MARSSTAREDMIGAAAALLAARGPAASGIQDIVAAAAAPRGSIYHHFPGGKDEVIICAIERVSADVEAALLAIDVPDLDPVGAVRRIAALFRSGPERSGWRVGCPVGGTAVEGAVQSEAVRNAVAAAFERWAKAGTGVMIKSGMRAHDARGFALAVIATLEGALLVSRGMRSKAPFDAAVDTLVAGAAAIDRLGAERPTSKE